MTSDAVQLIYDKLEEMCPSCHGQRFHCGFVGKKFLQPCGTVRIYAVVSVSHKQTFEECYDIHGCVSSGLIQELGTAPQRRVYITVRCGSPVICTYDIYTASRISSSVCLSAICKCIYLVFNIVKARVLCAFPYGIDRTVPRIIQIHFPAYNPALSAVHEKRWIYEIHFLSYIERTMYYICFHPCGTQRYFICAVVNFYLILVLPCLFQEFLLGVWYVLV